MHGAATLFESLSVEFAAGVDAARLAAVLTAPGSGVLRAKALLSDTVGRPIALQVVGARHEILSSAHAEPERGRLVCIGARGRLDAEAIRTAARAQ
jgi:hypothetical protein